MSKDRRHIPKASTLMGSLRSMGYSFESAVADVVDNSISAHAQNVRILFPSNPMNWLLAFLMMVTEWLLMSYLKLCVMDVCRQRKNAQKKTWAALGWE